MPFPELSVHSYHGFNQSALTNGDVVCYDPGLLLVEWKEVDAF